MDPRQKRWLPRPAVARGRYNRHPKTLERWETDPDMGFPKSREIRGRYYYAEDELDAYDAQGTISTKSAALPAQAA
jgi:hypothetical protein